MAKLRNVVSFMISELPADKATHVTDALNAKHGIDNWCQNPDGSIDVNGDVVIGSRQQNSYQVVLVDNRAIGITIGGWRNHSDDVFGVFYGTVTGSFKLVPSERRAAYIPDGLPRIIGGGLDLSSMPLRSLRGLKVGYVGGVLNLSGLSKMKKITNMPKYIGGLNVNRCGMLDSYEAKNSEIHGDVDIRYTNIRSFGPHLKRIDGSLRMTNSFTGYDDLPEVNGSFEHMYIQSSCDLSKLPSVINGGLTLEVSSTFDAREFPSHITEVKGRLSIEGFNTGEDLTTLPSCDGISIKNSNRLKSLKGIPSALDQGLSLMGCLELSDVSDMPSIIMGELVMRNLPAVTAITNMPRVVDSITLSGLSITELPDMSKMAVEYYTVSNCDELLSLVNSPTKVTGNCIISYNRQVPNLIGSPKAVKGDMKITPGEFFTSLDGLGEVDGVLDFMTEFTVKREIDCSAMLSNPPGDINVTGSHNKDTRTYNKMKEFEG